MDFLAGPEEAGDVLAGRLDHRVRFEHLQLAEQLVRQKGIEVGEGQMNRRRAIIDVLHGRAQIAPDAMVRVVHIADVDLAFGTVASATFRDRSVVCHELRLIDGFGLAVAPAEEGRHANTIALTVEMNRKFSISKALMVFVDLLRAAVLFA